MSGGGNIRMHGWRGSARGLLVRTVRHLAVLAIVLCVVLGMTSPAQAYFKVLPDGTVWDSSSKLIWDRCAWGQTGSDCSGTAWEGGWVFTNGLWPATYKGHNDWLRPSVAQLYTLFDGSNRQANGTAINGEAFPNSPSELWSQEQANTEQHKYVDFGVAVPMTYEGSTFSPGYSVSLRLVRGVPVDTDPSGGLIPSPFTFLAQTDVSLATWYVSNTVIIENLKAAGSPISISGGEYQINGGAWTSAAGSVQNADTVTVRVLSSSAYRTTTSANLTIGSGASTYTRAFSVKTLRYEVLPDGTVWDSLSKRIWDHCSYKITGVNCDQGAGFYQQSVTWSDALAGAAAANTSVYKGHADWKVPEISEMQSLIETGRSPAFDDKVFNSVVWGGSSYYWSQTVDPGNSAQVSVIRMEDGSTVMAAKTGSGRVIFVREGLFSDQPEAFSFTAQTNLAPGTQVFSNSITVKGLKSSAQISISGAGTGYRIGNGACTSATGSVKNDDVVSVCLTASSSYNGTTSATLTIGGVSATFQATTLRFIAQADGTVWDGKTGLLWDRCDWGRIGFDCRQGADGVKEYPATQRASMLTEANAAPGYKGHNDWGLPTKAQLLSLGSLDQNYFPNPNLTEDPNPNDWGYDWAASDGGSAWYMDFFTGNLVEDIEQHDPYGVRLVRGTVQPTPPADLIPDAFSFNAISNVALNSVQVSNAVTVTGIAAPAVIGVEGGEYEINASGTWQTGTATISNNATVRLRLHASASYGTTTSATLTIGGLSAAFSATTRAASSNANLSALNLSAGSLNPAFAAASTSYTVSVGATTSSITVTPTLADATASLKVNGTAVASASASGPIALSVGSNTVSIVVTAESGASRTYTLSVTRAAPSTNAKLSGLSLSSGSLSPAFAATTLAYTASVSNATASLTVTPTLADATATMTVNGTVVASGNASGAIALNVGANVITVAVTAQDGTTSQSYTITVTRAALSSNANLSALALSSGSLSPAFAAGTTAYTASVSYAVTSLKLTPTVADAAASVKVNGIAVTSGSASGAIALAVGDNPIGVVVTAENGTSRNYTVTVNRARAVSATVLTSSLNPAVAGQAVSFSVTVSGENPTGTVQFKDGADDLGAAQSLVAGSASYTSSVLAVGTHSITAVYSGDANNAGSASEALLQVVNAVDTTPEAFSFTAQTGVSRSTAINSNSITIAGINSGSPISVSGGEYRIGSGAWTAAAGMVNNGDTVTVRQTSSGAFSTRTTATLGVGGVSAGFDVTTLAEDTTPDSFSFTAQTGVARNTVINSNSITIAGINNASPISVSGGEYRIGSGAWTAAAGMVNNGDTVTVRQTSSGAFSTRTTATLGVGGVSAGFDVTTLAEDTTPDAFSFTAQTGVARSTAINSNSITIAGINNASPISVSGGEYRIGSGAWTEVAGMVNSGDTVTLRQTSSGAFSTRTTATLSIGGVSAGFDVTTLAEDTTPDTFSFTAQTGVARNTVINSNSITIAGINNASRISVTGGEYRIGSGAWTAVAGTVNSGDTVTLRQTSSSAFSTKTTATLSVGGVSAGFEVTTMAPSKTFSGMAPDGSGEITVSFEGGGAGCGFDRAAFIADRGSAASPPGLPRGVRFPFGMFDFATQGCVPGSSLSFTLSYPQRLPDSVSYWKYGPTADNRSPHWYTIAAVIEGRTVMFTLKDGGLGDDDLRADGAIVDQGGPGVLVSGVSDVPTLTEATLCVLAALLALSGMRAARRPR